MEFTAAVLHCICSILMLAALMTQVESSPAGDVCELVHSLHSLTDLQVEECKKYPELVSLLTTNKIVIVFRQQCKHHFKHEKWNCQDIDPPIFGVTQPFSTLQTKEAAFVYALASAAVVHAVAEICASNRLHYCGCDKTLDDEDLPSDERWEGCSPDMDFSINFAKSFVDRRVDNATLQYQKFVLHNNRVGQLAVLEYMHKTCTCTGSGTNLCSRDKKCLMELPTMDKVANVLRKQYDQSIYSMILASPSQQQQLVVERENLQEVHAERMIYFYQSPDYCTANPYYSIAGIAGRECTLRADTSSSHHCDNLCCDHGYEKYTYTRAKPCNCKFVWCCKVECEACNEMVTIHKCRNQPDVEVSSTTSVEVSYTTMVD